MKYVEFYDIDEFGFLIYKLRMKRGWKQRELAEKLGTSINYISILENSYAKKFDKDMLKKIADVFHVDIKICIVNL